ncbi:MAG: hypothetical protein HKN21_04320 [Candidatus Eisenbacteria bacterium]|uniref:Phospholipase/carboxylesterase/thioesterase domain-containing protein n=1 Tax=Eiseniibacteriota bacterium TaxID=2212470 RepID=A0A7Y2H1S5_UNCEI|nr:hypothetical protein [Candidatus Eisenbacteria bacterium]
MPLHISAIPKDPEAPLILFCHGMGETPEIFLKHWPKLTSLPVHLVAPAGPFPFEKRRPDKIVIGHAWYLYDGGEELFRRTVSDSAAWLREALLQAEATHDLKPRFRCLLGYSQGAYFGYTMALSNPDLFTHVIGAAGRVKESFLPEVRKGTPLASVLVLHGDEDAAVPPLSARNSKDALEGRGHPVTLETLPAGHRLTPAFDESATRWIEKEWAIQEG